MPELTRAERMAIAMDWYESELLKPTVDKVVARETFRQMVDEEVTLPIRSYDIFTSLQELANHCPYLRAGQVIFLVTEGKDPFYWEVGEWKKRISEVMKTL